VAEFDGVAANYEQLIDENIRITGESSGYFANYKARYIAREIAPAAGARLLDYGCGIGLLSKCLIQNMPRVRVDGFDPSPESLGRVAKDLLAQGIFTAKDEELAKSYDLIVISNVLHHVKPAERRELIKRVTARLGENANLVIFEHNPYNPVTRWAVSQCAFDGDAILLPPGETQSYLKAAGLLVRKDYIVFFPRFLRWLRPLEPSLKALPLGAQYVTTGRRER
jgi:2-polyprenyl-3-methyl-5-hydroxy-6-metoxy-1,4-benzoquinol methylase